MTHRLKVIVNDKPYIVEIEDPAASPLTVIVNGTPHTVAIESAEAESVAAVSAPQPKPAAPPSKVPGGKSSAPIGQSSKQIKAPMPGAILDINIKPGDRVSIGQQLCALEAMKMKSAIRSPREGVVATVEVGEGQGVAYGDTLITFE
ncbi:MAG: acetyl-CoA carboxylase biotin carboxyl carrier protein subunit [Chloroflexi bacterium]|nr:acetyl-CoA carboxylase biotin carboxyl carrier protein subunit [Chloroflexota bacterium]